MDLIFEPERKTSLSNYDVTVEEDKEHPATSHQAGINYESYYILCYVNISAHMGMV